MTRIRLLKTPLTAVWAFLVLGFCTLSSAQDQPTEKAKSSAGLTPEQRQRNLESFEYVWKTIRDKHWDPKIGGLDWQAVHKELRPRMEKADSMSEGRDVLRSMLQRLGQSHYSIIPHDVYRELDKSQARPGASSGVPGFDVRVVDDQVLVVNVTKNTPAAALGVRPGWQVLKIAGEDLVPVLAKVRTTGKTNPYGVDFQLYRTVLGRMQGNAGDKLAMIFRNADDREVAVDVTLVQPAGVRAQFGNLPAFFVL
jgi:C-terminal processing protease CtpA/Prc